MSLKVKLILGALALVALVIVVFWFTDSVEAALGTGVFGGLFGAKASKKHILKETQAKAEKLKEAHAQELEAIDEQAVAEAEELESIQNIEDEGERLAALAAFANRRRGG